MDSDSDSERILGERGVFDLRSLRRRVGIWNPSVDFTLWAIGPVRLLGQAQHVFLSDSLGHVIHKVGVLFSLFLFFIFHFLLLLVINILGHGGSLTESNIWPNFKLKLTLQIAAPFNEGISFRGQPTM